MTVEMPRPVLTAKIGGSGLAITVEASIAECAALAARMDIPAIGSLNCAFSLTRERDGVSFMARGTLQAAVTRICVTSAEEFEVPVFEAFTIRFVPEGKERDDLDPDVPDEIPYAHDTIDLGEAAAEQLALALDPYPRMPGALPPDIAGVVEVLPDDALPLRGKLA